MSDAAPPPPRAVVLALAVLTVVVVGVLGLALFWGDIVEDNTASSSTALEPVVVDDFDRPDGPLGGDWSEDVGVWIVQDEHAALSSLSSDAPYALTVLPADDPAVVEVTARAVEPGWGLAFRVAGPEDLLAVVARDESWSVAQVADGEVTELGSVAAVPRDNAVVRVELVDQLVRVTVDDVTAEVSGPAVGDAADVGLLAVPGASLASMAWDDLTITAS